MFSKNIDDLPEDLTSILKPQNIKSILIYPIFVKGCYFGFIGFDECIENKTWPEDETELLRAVSSILSNSFERRKITSQLQENELRLKLAINSANEGLWDWNIKTGEVYFNDVWSKMLGYDPDEIDRHVNSWEKLVHPEDMDYVNSKLNKFLSGEDNFYETVYRMKTKDGQWKWILDHGMVIERNPSQEPLRAIGTHIDITSQKETEIQLQSLVNTKDKFFSIIAHDLKNPFTVLLGLSEIILDEMDSINQEDMKSYISNIYEVSKNTHSLLDNLLTWARSQKDDLKMSPVPNNISFLADETISLLFAMAEKKQISLENNVPAELAAYCDKNAALTVIRNLMSNSVKFTRKGGKITIHAIETRDNIELHITDNGVGMEKSIADKLFRSNITPTTRGTADEKGSGLGLILCKELVEKNGGTISVQSTLGLGSTFSFTLPKVKL